MTKRAPARGRARRRAAGLAAGALLALGLAGCRLASATAATAADPFRPGEWVQLFNGRDLDGWLVKLNHHPLGDNYGDTFRVEDGLLRVRYDRYGAFGDRFGHLYYERPFSHYRLAVEYRFVGALHAGAPGYAALNSGVMFHAQDPRTILLDQNWPIALELQFLAGLPDGKPRPTGNVCTPGTHVVHNGKLTEAHIIPSTAETYRPEDWVRAEVIVHGSERIVHLVNGKKVLEYSQPQIGGGVVSGHDPKQFQVGRLLSEGFIGLQSEGQPVDFRKVELQVLDPVDLTSQAAATDGAWVDLPGRPLSACAHFSETPGARLSEVWSLSNGVLVCRGAPRGYLTLAEGLADFTLSLEWRRPAGVKPGKAGVLIRVTGPDKIWPRSLEAQLNAGAAGDFWGLDGFALDGPAERKSTVDHPQYGRLTNLKRTADAERPAGEWNRYEIEARGGTVALRVNGVEVNRATGCDAAPGRVVLTAEGDAIEFRGVRLHAAGRAE